MKSIALGWHFRAVRIEVVTPAEVKPPLVECSRAKENAESLELLSALTVPAFFAPRFSGYLFLGAAFLAGAAFLTGVLPPISVRASSALNGN